MTLMAKSSSELKETDTVVVFVGWMNCWKASFSKNGLCVIGVVFDSFESIVLSMITLIVVDNVKGTA